MIDFLEKTTGKRYFLYKSIPIIRHENVVYRNYITTYKNLVSVKHIFDGITGIELKIKDGFPVSISEKDIDNNLNIFP